MRPAGGLAVGLAARSAAGLMAAVSLSGVGRTAEAHPFGHGRIIEEEMLLTVTEKERARALVPARARGVDRRSQRRHTRCAVTNAATVRRTF